MKYHNYIFFYVDKRFYDLSHLKQKQYSQEFLNCIKKQTSCITYSYTILGFKGQMQFFLWRQADSVEMLQDSLNILVHTSMGRYLHIAHTLLGFIRQTQYSEQSTVSIDTTRHGGKYLIIYPFTKQQSWHMLSFAKRNALMKGHIAIGRTYPQINQLLLYSFGIDDSEFIVSYEADDLTDFQTLVMDLRADKVRNYTRSDTPIFTGVYRTLEDMLSFL